MELLCLSGWQKCQYGQRRMVTILNIVGKRLAFRDKFSADGRGSRLPGSQRVENVVQRRICTAGELPATAAMDCVVSYGLVLRTIHL